MDQALFSFIHGLSGRSQIADDVIVSLARWLPYLLVAGFFLLLAKLKGFRRRIFFFAQTALVLILSRGIMVEVMHELITRARPFAVLGVAPLVSEAGNGMPSGHAAFFFGLAFAVHRMDRRWGIAYLTLAAVNGIARVAAGVHYPTDVLAGAAIGLASGYLIERLLASYLPPKGGEEAQKEPVQAADGDID